MATAGQFINDRRPDKSAAACNEDGFVDHCPG
jgi:hypothetical protein